MSDSTQRKLDLFLGSLAGIHSIPDAAKEPRTRLEKWSVYEVKLPSEPERTRHLVGRTLDRFYEGRVSSKMTAFDATAGTCTTRDTRTYELDSWPGGCADADYVWATWKDLNSAKEVVDVTREVWSAMRESAPKGRAEHSRVALTRSLPDLKLSEGAVGLVRNVNDTTFEVEFITKRRATICIAAVDIKDLRYVD